MSEDFGISWFDDGAVFTITRPAKLNALTKPVLDGLAACLELAMACLLRIAAPHATFGLPEVKLGLLPAYAGTQFLPALVGRGRAEELMLTGRTFDLDEAVAIGLVRRTGPSGRGVVADALDLAREIASHSAVAVAAIRDCVATAAASIGDAGLRAEDRHVRSVFAGAEAQAGIAAFLRTRSVE